MAVGGVILRVDTSELSGLIEGMRAVHTEQEFRKLMYRAFRRAAPRVRTILRREIPHDYHAKSSWISRQVGKESTSIGGTVSCIIPVEGARGYIGKQGVYGASANVDGASIRSGYAGRKGKRTRRAYKISAQVVTSGASTLPGSGGTPVHFMVFSGPNRGKVYARLDKQGHHIRAATGIGLPQMPMNRTQDAVQEGIARLLQERIEHEHEVLIRGLAR